MMSNFQPQETTQHIDKLNCPDDKGVSIQEQPKTTLLPLAPEDQVLSSPNEVAIIVLAMIAMILLQATRLVKTIKDN